MEAFLRGWDNGRKRRSGRLAMAGVTAGGRDDAHRAATSVDLAPITGTGAEGEHVALIFWKRPTCLRQTGQAPL